MAAREDFSGKSWKLTSSDKAHIKELSKHIHRFSKLLTEWREDHEAPKKIASAYHKIWEDSQSSNKLESELAQFILGKFSNFHLKVETNGHQHTAHSFLMDFYNGKITDSAAIELGLSGLSSNFGLKLLELCNTDAIEEYIRKQS